MVNGLKYVQSWSWNQSFNTDFAHISFAYFLSSFVEGAFFAFFIFVCLQLEGVGASQTKPAV